jgi:hypothetical protein
MAKKKKSKKKKSATGPNRFPRAVTAAHREALRSTCKFLGKTFEEGETICYQGGEWVCAAGSWAKTGRHCG